MAIATIHAGICGFTTTVNAQTVGDAVKLTITSECEAICKLGDHLTMLNPYQEITFRRAVPQTYQEAMKYCTHAACPVPVGIIKVIEVESGLALPADVNIQLRK